MAPSVKEELPPKEKEVINTTDSASAEDVAGITEEKDSEEHYMSGVKLHVLIFGLALSVFLMALDISILSTAIPVITEKFHSTADIGWYVSGYLLTLCSLQPISGKLYANFSLKWTFMSFFFVFEFGSLLSGVATSSAMLITGRAIAGAGAAGLMSGTLSIVGVVVTLRLRALYTGILSSMFGVATIAGPLLSGVFTQHVSWRWVFLVNLPIGGFIIVVLMFMFQPPTRKVEQDPLKERIRRLDLIGAAMFIPSVIMLLLALQWGGLTYPWNSGRIIGLFVGGGIILIIFSVWQWRTGDVAMIPPPIFTQRSVFWACLCAMFGMGAQMMLGLWIPEWFQAVKGNSPVQSGVHLLPSMLAQTVSAIISGAGITMLGYYNPWVIAGPALMSIACGLFTTWDVNTGSAYWIGYQVIYGLGAGIFITGPIVAVQTVLTPANTPVGISTVTFFQFFGGALFSALSQTIFNEQLLKQLAKNVPGVNVAALLAAGTAALETVATPDQLPGILKSYNRALLDPFYLAAAIDAVSCFCALGLEWVNVKGKNLASGA